MSVEKKIKKRARELGFSLSGITRLVESGYRSEYREWIEKGMHSKMEYMERTEESRINPGKRFPWAKSVLVLAMNYWQGPLPEPEEGEVKISRYAIGRDYHSVLSEKLEVLSHFIKDNSEAEKTMYYVDTGSIIEKELARRAGIGWIGKNTLIINERYGSWLFLGEIILDIELDVDEPAENKCGDCKKCIRACPSSAFENPYILNTAKCTAYHTVQNPGELPDWFPSEGNPFVFGCDICQSACPYNGETVKTEIDDFIPGEDIINPEPSNLINLSDGEFDRIYGDTPIAWAGKERLLRNAGAFLK